MRSIIYYLLGLNSDFKKLFFTNEYIALAGEKAKTILSLLLILFFTFLALGFAVGSLENLKDKMDNPFTSWVDLPISESYIAKQLDAINTRYGGEKATELSIVNTGGFSRFFQDFYSQKNDLSKDLTEKEIIGRWGRTLEPNSNILKAILDVSSDNLLSMASSEKEQVLLGDCEIIVTQEMLKDLDYENLKAGQYLSLVDEEISTKINRPLLIYIKAVVKELPSLSKFVVTPKLYNILKGKKAGSKRCEDLISRNEKGNSTFLFLVEESTSTVQIQEYTDKIFKQASPSINFTKDIYLSNERKLKSVQLSFFPTETPTRESIKAFVADCRKENIAISELSTIECGTSICQSISNKDIHYMSFNFGRLDFIRSFRNDMNEKFEIDIDMAQVEEKENFARVSQLTFTISSILLGFGILSIVLFVNNLLRTHLFEVRSNLGTFKAFGLSNKFLISNYLKIIFSFLVVAIIVAFLLAVGVDFIEGYLFKTESRFMIFNNWILAAIISLLLISLLFSARTIHKILGDTPGNLIYER